MSEAVSKEVLSRLQPLSALGDVRLGEIAGLCRVHHFPRNSDPFRVARYDDQVVYLIRGELKVTSRDGGTRVLVGGFDRAAAPIAQGDMTPQSSFAITDVQLLSLDEDALDIAVTWSEVAKPATAAASAEIPDWQLMSGMFAVNRLTQSAFANLPTANIARLLERFVRISVKHGQEIIHQGDEGDYYYLIEKGRCKVERNVGGSTIDLADLTIGESFGEEALVANAPRSATVTMKTDGVLLRLAKQDFAELLVAPMFKKVDYATACKRVAGGALWIDVRFPAEFNCDGLLGAINIPLNTIRQAAATLDRKKEYIVYCQTGRRSSAAAFLLSQRGVNAVLLDGGMKQCAASLECVE